MNIVIQITIVVRANYQNAFVRDENMEVFGLIDVKRNVYHYVHYLVLTNINSQSYNVLFTYSFCQRTLHVTFKVFHETLSHYDCIFFVARSFTSRQWFPFLSQFDPEVALRRSSVKSCS